MNRSSAWIAIPCRRLASLLSCSAWLLLGVSVCAANPTQDENAKAGSPDWQLTNPATNHEIEGFASLTSVNRGGQISFLVNTADPSFTLDVFRMGWYGGAGARRMMTRQFTGTRQPIPQPDPTTGLIECQWINPYVLAIPADDHDPTNWASGVYLARLTGSVSGKQSFILFVVRDDARFPPYVFQLSVNTFQAYNNWGGKSLYRWNSVAGAAVNVSFDRPYAIGNQSNSASGVGAGEFLTNVQPISEGAPAGWSYNMLRFLEREGYDVSYITDVDAHESRSLLPSHQALLVVGHSEYWSWQMRANVEFARDSGVGLGFFSSNTCYWQIRFGPDSTAAPDRTIIAYKDTGTDPYASNPALAYLTTTQWRLPPVNRPEDAFTGVAYTTDLVNGDIVVSNPAHWVYTFTGLQNGARLPGMLGYEVDAMAGHQPASTVAVAHGTAPADTTVYTSATGTTVFAAGSFQWSWGLDDFNTPNIRPSIINPAAQQITRNVLARLIGFASTPSFSIVPSPRLQTVTPASNASFTINTTAFGYAPTIALTVSGLPASVSYTLSPATLNGSDSATLTITLSPGMPYTPGTYLVTISANDGVQVRTESVWLTLSPTIIDKTAWRLVYVDSEELQCENGIAPNGFDGLVTTFWISRYCGNTDPLPHELQIDMGSAYPINGFRYLPRQDGGIYGRIGRFEFYATNDLSNWGAPLVTGTFVDGVTENSVPFAPGSYRYIRLRALTEVNGGPWTSMAELSVYTNTPPSGTATFVRSDSTTQGTWQGTYGAEGYSLAADATSLPSYAQVALTGQSQYVWVDNTSDVRALQKPTGGRKAATWYASPTFSIDITTTDGASHAVALYMVDWDSPFRVQTIDVIDPATNSTIDTRTASSFSSGRYLVWTISGHVRLRVRGTAGSTAVISGLFFGGSQPLPVATLTAMPPAIVPAASSTLSWSTANATSVLIDQGIGTVPTSGSRTVSPSVTTTYTLTAQGAGGSATAQATVTVMPMATASLSVTPSTVTAGQPATLSWSTSNATSVSIAPGIGAVGATGSMAITPAATTTYTLSASNAVGSASATATVTVTGVPDGSGNAAQFLRTDAATQGSWIGTFGSDGYLVAQEGTAVPAYAEVGLAGQSGWVWSSTTSDVRALQHSTGSGRFAATWYAGTSFTADVTFTGGTSHAVALYMVDWDSPSRAQTIDVLDPATNAVLDSRTVANFQNGLYLVWQVSGSVRFRITRTGGANVVISGMFFGGSGSGSGGGRLVKVDSTTQGSWRGVYGAQGYALAADGTAVPVYAELSRSGSADYIWTATTTDVRALQQTNGPGRIAAAWYAGTSFVIDVTITDGRTHNIALYLLDWDSPFRAETIDLLDPITNGLLDTRSASQFRTGVYLVWQVSSSVRFRVTATAGADAVVSGMFFDAP